ncbi:type II secretion system minor pseudopilin GspI [Janthinobacterium agaricidamnosum]|uniref:Type II secretion system protein I n=1 Tax=Janthinobacterium agaricidamnosum NBRC 102515 = DSM 9628 TaxID=1349767 RepID=W0VDC3_9BURK|nr:type II secretion system minor pseudopilin GspI [Janthinobacterium agaricidamnosum]CDG85660.1 general secretion pathway protein I [Janthinobacterium agaricidamnosum NBRC 102515 = DSM 9628]
MFFRSVHLSRLMPRRRARGFTLLEVLVALVIVGTALGASLRAVGSLTQNSNGLRSAMMATWAAENQLVHLRLEKIFPPVGKTSFDCPQGDLLLECRQEVIATGNPRMRRVQLSVYETAHPDRLIVRLVLLSFNQ